MENLRKSKIIESAFPLLFLASLIPLERNPVVDVILPYLFNPLLFPVWGLLAVIGASLAVEVMLLKLFGAAFKACPAQLQLSSPLLPKKTPSQDSVRGVAKACKKAAEKTLASQAPVSTRTRKLKRILASILIGIVVFSIFIRRPELGIALLVSGWWLIASKLPRRLLRQFGQYLFGPTDPRTGLPRSMPAHFFNLTLNCLLLLSTAFYLFWGGLFLVLIAAFFLVRCIAVPVALNLWRNAISAAFQMDGSIGTILNETGNRLARWLFDCTFWGLGFFFSLSGALLQPDCFFEFVLCGCICAAIWSALAEKSTSVYMGAAIEFIKPPLFLAAAFCIWRFAPLSATPTYMQKWALFAVGAICMAALSVRQPPNRRDARCATKPLFYFGCAATFLIFFSQNQAGAPPNPKTFSKIADLKAVYGLRLEPHNQLLYFTSTEAPYFGKIDLRTGAEDDLKGRRLYHPERIAAVADNIYIGGRMGIHRFGRNDWSNYKLIRGGGNIDIESGNSNYLFSVSELSNALWRFDANSGKSKIVFLKGIHTWPYSLLNSPKNNALYISCWATSPHVYRVDETTLKMRRAYLGPMSAGMCAMPSSNRLAVARSFNRRADLLDMDTLKKVGEVPLEFGVREIRCDEKHNLLLAATHFFGYVQAVDVNSKKEISRIKLDEIVRSIEYDESKAMVYIGSESGIYKWNIESLLQREDASVASLDAAKPSPDE